MGYVLHTPCPEIYCLRLIDEYCENYAEILCVLVYCIGMCLRQNSFQEKSPAITIWHSSIDEATIAQDLH